jgi:hypothetical protein
MRGRLLQAIAERDHYMAALKSAGIDPGPPPAPPTAVVVAAPSESAPADEAAEDAAD